MRTPTGPLMLAALLASLPGTAPVCRAAAARAQDTPSWDKLTPKPKPKPAAPRPAPRKPPRRAPTAASPLEVEYRVFKVNENNSQVEVNSVTVFNRGDRVRLAVKANADLYLFVIHQKSPAEGGRIFIPDSRFNNGQNLLERGREFAFPDDCPPGGAASDCSYLVDAAAGQEYFTLIFSRRPSLDLLDSATAAGGVVGAQAIDDYVNNSGRRLDTSGRGASVFARSVRNLNQKDDKVVVRLMLNKRG
jgi:Domain of unknown function (DUF4384)